MIPQLKIPSRVLTLSILYFSLTIFLLPIDLLAQSQNQIRTDLSAISDQVFIRKDNSISLIKIKNKISKSSAQFIKENHTNLGIGSEGSLVQRAEESDKYGFTTKKYKQLHRGVEIVGAEAIFHEKNGKLKSVTGRILPELTLDIVPSISEASALEAALASINASSYRWQQVGEEDFTPQAKLQISAKDYSSKTEDMRLVYGFDIYALEPLGRYVIEVDAHNGKIINQYDRIHHTDTPVTGDSWFNGTVDFTADFDNVDLYQLTIGGKNITTKSLRTSTSSFDAVAVTSNDTHFDDEMNKEAVSAHWATEASYDYFLEKFGISGYNNGTAINTYTNYGVRQSNAFWDGTGFFYGDGVIYTEFYSGNTTPHVCLDIVGHEYTHAITYFASGLIYQNESGALNESFSDIFGQNIEVYKNPTGWNWSLGNEVYPNGGSYREMGNPKSRQQPSTYLGDYWWTSSEDNGGVHTNSGVQNYWYYLLTEGGTGTNDKGFNFSVQGIGLDKAAEITYRNLTTYMTSNSNHVDARVGAEQSAIDLYGDGSAEHLAVQNVWDAVGVPRQAAELYAPSELDFEEVYVSDDKSLELKLLNLGLGDLLISSVTIDNPLFTSDLSSFIIGGNADQTLKIKYDPTVVQSDMAVMTVVSDVNTITVNLTGNAIPFPTMSISPAVLSATVACGDVFAQSITIENTGQGNLSWTGSTGAPLSLDVLSGDILGGNSAQVAVSFDATGLIANDYAYQIILQSNDSMNTSMVVPYSLTVTGSPVIQASSTFPLHQVYSGLSFTKDFKIENTGYDTLKISDIQFSSSDIDFVPTSINIPAQSSANIALSFRNLSVGTLSETMTINSNTDPHIVSISAEVSASPLTLDLDTISLTVNSGEVGMANLSLSNLLSESFSVDIIPSDTFTVSTAQMSPKHHVTKAAMIRSWGASQQTSQWNDLDGSFSDVELDYTILNKTDITYADLQALNADVLIIPNTHFFFELTETELDAIIRYTEEGHGLIAYYGTLGFKPSHNRLAPLFGMSKNVTYLQTQSYDRTSVPVRSHEIYEHIALPQTLPGSFTVSPATSWAEANQAGELLAISVDEKAAVIRNFNRIYYSDWRHNGGGYDERSFLRNLIRFADKSMGGVSVDIPSFDLSAAASQSIELKMSTAGLLAGDYLYDVNVFDANSDILVANVPIKLKVIGIASLAVTDAVAFTNTDVGDISTHKLVLENDGTNDLVIEEMIFSHASFDANRDFPITIAPFDTTSVVLTFDPNSIGEVTAALAIKSNDKDSPTSSVTLSGIGMGTAQLKILADTINVSLLEGDSVSKNLSLQNLGAVDLNWTATSSLGDVMQSFDLPQYSDDWRGVVALNDLIYVGHYASGDIYAFNPQDQTYSLAFTVPDNRIDRMATDGTSIFIGVAGYGIYKYSLVGSLTDYFKFGNNSYVPIDHQNGSIWRAEAQGQGTSSAMLQLDLDGNTLASYPMDQAAVSYGMVWTDNQNLLMLDRNGPNVIKHFAFDGSQFSKVDFKEVTIAGRPGDIAYDAQDVWAIDYDGKLLRMDYSGNTHINTSAGTVGSNQSGTVHLSVGTTGLAPGIHHYHLTISSDDPNAPDTKVPIKLTVIANEGGNLAPIISLDDVIIVEDESLSINLSDHIVDEHETIQISYTVISTQSDLWPNVSVDDIDVSGFGDLHIQGDPGVSGVFEIQVTAQDLEGLSASQIFSVTILPVNDAPSFTLGGSQTIAVNAGPQQLSNFATDIKDNDLDAQSLTFLVSTDRPSLFKTQPTIDAQGTLSYELDEHTLDVAQVNVILKDNGGVEYGGVPIAVEQSFTIEATDASAYFHFNNGDANDYIGSYHPTSSTGVSYHSDQRNFMRLDHTGLVNLPTQLSASMAANQSFQITFDVKLTTGNAGIILSAQSPMGSVFTNPGFGISATIADPVANLYFTYGDDTNHGTVGIGGLALDEWHSVTLIIDLNADQYEFTVGNEVRANTFSLSEQTAAQFTTAIANHIFTLGGIDGVKSFDGQIDLDELKIWTPSPGLSNDVKTAFHSMYQDLIGAHSLSEIDKAAHLATIQSGLSFSQYDIIKDSLFAYTHKYEELNPPLFSDNYAPGAHILVTNLPIHDQVILAAQAHVFDTQFSSELVSQSAGIKYEFGELFPGAIADTAVRGGGTVEVDGSYHIDIAAAYGMQEFVVRPTGYYLAAGDLSTVEVPAALINEGLSVIVGAHFRNMIPGKTNRPTDVSLEYPITSTTTTVANPYGGGIYIKIPEGKSLGWFNVTVGNAIKSPYFSWREGRKSDVQSWLTEIQNTEAPWLDFESDKFMFTIPTALGAKTQTPGMVMARWDSIMDAYRIAGGRPVDTRIRAEYYTADRKLVTPAYGSGYPTVITLAEMDRPNSDWDPINALTIRPAGILLHEMGHTAMHPTIEYVPVSPCDYEYEAESIVHVPIALINEYLYKMKPDAALANSGVGYTVSGFDQAAFDWIISSNFRNNQPISFDPQAPMANKDMMNYQVRGWAKYIEIAKAYSWDTLSDIFGKYYTPGTQQVSNATCTVATLPNLVSRESFIQYSSDVIGENMAPFFDFWGITPSTGLVTSLSSLPKSQKVKAMIEYYSCNVAPQSVEDFTTMYNAVYATMGYQQPRYDLYLSEFDQTYVTAINDQFALLLSKYGLFGPSAPSNLALSSFDQQVNATWTDHAADETGFILRYRLTGDQEFVTLATLGSDITTYDFSSLPYGTYEFMVTAINAEGLESSHCEATIFALTIEKPLFIWNGSVWNHGSAPSAVDHAQIDGDYTFSIHGVLEVNNLHVSTGATLSVNENAGQGSTLIVHGVLSSDGLLHVTSGASLITWGAVTGTGYQIDRTTTFDANTGKYSVVGSPIHNASFTTLGASARIYGYDESALYNPSGNAGLDRFKTPMALSHTEMNVGAGYFSAYTGDANGLISFAGTPNTGDMIVSLSYTDQGIAEESATQGFNLVSNPYPSAIDFTALMAANITTDITGTIYLWDDSNSDAVRGGNADYVVVNAMGNTDSQSSGLSKWDGKIRSGQGFFVQANSLTDLLFNNSTRAATLNEDVGYFRSKEEHTTVKLLISDGTNHSATVIGFVDDATTALDKHYDAINISSSELQIYSLQAQAKANLAIQGLPTDYPEELSIGVKVPDGREYTVSLVEDAGHNIRAVMFKDRLTGQITNLLDESYRFISTQSVDEERFTLLASSLVTQVEDDLDESIYAYSTAGQLHVVFDSQRGQAASIELVDLSGRSVLKRSEEILTKEVEISTVGLPKSIYILVVSTAQGWWKQRVITQ